MAPIRVALIGLSASAVTAWAATAHLPYLRSPLGRSRFEIVGILNSSVATGEAAVAKFELPASTRVYASPAELAADPAVDLVVCVTRVDLHAGVIEPSVAAGKAVLCEWPLAQSGDVAARLVEEARRAGTLDRTVIGTQGRVSPLAATIRGLIDGGRIGKVLSAEVRAFGGTPRDSVPPGWDYTLRREVGGNMYTIILGHGRCPTCLLKNHS